MSRTIGGATTWGSNGETWADTTLTNPSGSTWAVTAPTSDLALRLLDDPDTAQGVPVGARSSGALRFVVQALNPTAGIDSVWGTALWGSSDWSASAGQWQDISSRVRGVTWRNGQGSPNTKAAVGLATVTLDNRDGLVSSWATSGAFVGPSSTSWIRTGLLIRWGVIRTSALAAGLPALDTFSAFFTGKVEFAVESTVDNADGQVDLTLVETPVDLGAVTPDDQVVNANRMLTATIFDALTGAGWGYQTSLSVPNEDALVPDTTLSGGSSTSRIDQLSDGMHWDFCADGRGRIIVVPRHLSNAASGVTFSNKPTGAQLPVVGSPTTYSSVERLINQVTAARINAALVTEEDTRSIAQFGTITNGYGFPRSDLVVLDDATVAALGRRVVSLRAWDDLGIGSIDLDMDQDPVNLPAVLAFIACRAREMISFDVVFVHPSGNTLTETVVIEGQTHSVVPIEAGAQLKWTATLNTGHSGVTSES